MSGLREGETDKFPFHWNGSNVWYFIVSIINGKMEHHKYASSVTRERDFAKIVSDLMLLHNTDPQNQFTIFGVWHGQYRTDIFVLDPQIVLDKLGVMV